MSLEAEVVWLRFMVQIYREPALLGVTAGSAH